MVVPQHLSPDDPYAPCSPRQQRTLVPAGIPAQGKIILHHRVVQPVLIREWSIPVQSFVGAIWQSQPTETRKFAE